MIKIGICDDEQQMRKTLRQILEQVLQLRGTDHQISEYGSGEELTAGISYLDTDILFLDIEMKNLDGIETAKLLRKKGMKGIIIFVTAYPDFVFQGYEVHAFHYILKPYRKEKIEEQLSKLGLKVHLHEPKSRINKDTDIYLVNSFGKTKSFYSIIKNVFLGGSLIKHGGQNPLEAVRYNCNILHGPNVSNFNEIYKFLYNQKISKKVININQTINILDKLFNSKKSQKNIKDKINKIGQKILKKNIDEINLILDKV